MKLEKIIFTVCMKHKIELYPPNKTEKDSLDLAMKMNVNDSPFFKSFNSYIDKHKKSKKSFWTTDMWKFRFCKTYNLKYKKTFNTF